MAKFVAGVVSFGLLVGGCSASSGVKSTPSDAGEAGTESVGSASSSVGSRVGYDHGSAVSPRYSAPFRFAGRLHEVVIEVAQPQASGAAEARSTRRDEPAVTLTIEIRDDLHRVDIAASSSTPGD